MTTTTTTTEASHVRPLGVVPLAPGHLACRHCGQAVAREDAARIDRLASGRYRPSDPDELKEYRARQAERAREYGGLLDDSTLFEFAVCESCCCIEQRATRLITEHPRVSARLGSIAADRAHVALFRLAALGKPISDAAVDTATDATLHMLLQQMGLGGSPGWAQRFHPDYDRAAATDPRSSAPEPWAHVDTETRRTLQEMFVGWLAARSDTPRPTPCPLPRGGCVLCGVSSVMALKRDAHHAWTPFDTTSDRLGGRGNQPIRGHLCPACQHARHECGVVGPTLIDTAVLAVVDPDRRLRRRRPDDVTLDGIQAHAVTGLPPFATAWEHVDLAALRDELSRIR